MAHTTNIRCGPVFGGQVTRIDINNDIDAKRYAAVRTKGDWLAKQGISTSLTTLGNDAVGIAANGEIRMADAKERKRKQMAARQRAAEDKAILDEIF